MPVGVFDPFGRTKPKEEKKKISNTVFDPKNPLDTEKPPSPVPYIALECTKYIIRFEEVENLQDVQHALVDAIYDVQQHNPSLVVACGLRLLNSKMAFEGRANIPYRKVSSLTHSLYVPASSDEEFVEKIGALFLKMRNKTLLKKRNIQLILKG